MTSLATHVSRARFFEWYAQSLWPFHRLFVRRYLSRRCSRCILSEKCSPLEGGLCEVCRTGKKTEKKRPSPISKTEERKFESILHSHEGQGPARYDALLLLSGGKDSAFLLHKLRAEYPALRILALMVDNGFTSPVALENAQLTAEKLETDHFVARPAPSVFKKLFRYALTHLKGRNSYEVVDRMDGDLIHDIGRHTAAEMRIPLLLSGVSWAQVEKIFNIPGFEMPREGELRKREQSAGFKLTEIFDAKELIHWWNPGFYPKENVARVFFPFAIWRLDEQEIRRKVRDLNLIPAGHDSPLVTNNALVPVMGVRDVLTMGYSSFEPEFAQMVREGKTDRKLWFHIYEMLEFSAKTGWLLEKDVKQTLKRLGLCLEDIIS